MCVLCFFSIGLSFDPMNSSSSALNSVEEKRVKDVEHPNELFITSWKMKKVALFLILGLYDMKKKCKEKSGLLSFVDPPKFALFPKIMKMRCFNIFDILQYKNKLIIIMGTLTLSDGVSQ